MTESSATSSQVIFFDCWHTLFTSDLGTDLRAIATLLNVKFDHPMVRTFETTFMCQTYPDLKAPITRFLNHYNTPGSPELITKIEHIILAGLERQRAYPDTLIALEELSQHYQLGLITNSFSIGFDHLHRQFNLEKYFTYLLPSCELGTIKPDPKLFQQALTVANITPEQAIMVGDSLGDDIEPARALGMRAILIDRQNQHPDEPDRITELTELLANLLKQYTK